MRKFVGVVRVVVAAMLLPVMLVQQGWAWGHDGHSMINRVAVASLPADVPEFLRSKAAQEAVYFYGPEPDHWREKTEPTLYAAISPDHFLDMEYTEILGELPRDRFSYLQSLEKALAAHPEIKIRATDVGMLPYATVEYYEQLKNTMRTYRKVVADKQDTRPVEAEIIFLAGILGHFVADGSQPLHTTMQYNGWTGPNPNGYTVEHKIHSKFEGDYVHFNVKAGDFAGLVGATKPTVIADVFADDMAYLQHSNSLVEKTYQLEKTGAFAEAGTPAGKEFVDERLAAGAIKLRDLIYTAWVRSGDPVPVSNYN
jgi:S1/P1 Nuclease